MVEKEKGVEMANLLKEAGAVKSFVHGTFEDT